MVFIAFLCSLETNASLENYSTQSQVVKQRQARDADEIEFVFLAHSFLISDMLPAKRLLDEVISSLRTVIAPAIADPYPKSQAFMAAVILEFVSQQVTERSDIETAKHAALDSVFVDLAKLLDGSNVANVDGDNPEARLCAMIERLYAQREILGEKIFTRANRRIRQALRELLDQDLKVAAQKKG